ncbi:uncharacterized protein LOC111624303 isoform X2 [Centruroides sculpturatus]|nr:uncharacterized protein LOC111624303 isoform X2 [Centruroides sculpturatus]XP_023222884.1 uncharacterized protein LOC111624303 isoform X2 [Centruroides sculpturatus]
MEDEENMMIETRPLIQNSEHYNTNEEIKKWDVFGLLPHEEEDQTEISKFLKYCTKVLKFISYIVTFVIVLVTSILAKSTLLLMTSMVRPKQKFSTCIADDESGKEFQVEIDENESRGWIWCLYFVLVIPDVFVLIRSIRICIFKSIYKPKLKATILIVFIFETFHCLGLTLLVFGVFPNLYVIHAAMLASCVCFLPSIFQLISRNKSEKTVAVKIIIDLICIFAQGSGLVIFFFAKEQTEVIKGNKWILPFALFLTSFHWWENFVNKNSQFKCMQTLANVKNDLRKCKYLISLFISLWKIVLTLAIILTVCSINSIDVKSLFTKFKSGFEDVQNNITRTIYSGDNSYLISSSSSISSSSERYASSDGMLPVYVTVLHVLSCWLCYISAKFACRTCIQGFGFSLPLYLTTPTCLFLIVFSCKQKLINSCYMNFLSNYAFWTCAKNDLYFYVINVFGALWIAWFLSQMWITIHVWTPKSERLASTEKLFVNSMYCGVIMDHSLLLNRRKHDDDDDQEYKAMETPNQSVEIDAYYDHINDVNTESTTRIYACATMWHETKDEMSQLLKSLFRMDEDQCARRNAIKFLQVRDVDYYEFEAHIFFDDAFEESEENEDYMVINQFVRLLIREIDNAASTVHECEVQLLPPKVIPTPYGGRLVWMMPGSNKLIVHLKDKSKIRHKKRWSQVMYMYYLLGAGIMELNIDSHRKSQRAENTYILALDGDINFRPFAVQLLVDLMKKNPVLGAACGRIHPVGSGLMVWYQKFEYAIGHWLQKATEHMIGCVLCSPGCFSLFRAKALMDDNVMRKYNSMSEEARHYVQYDQGEDRWLCTLLLQRGYKVEYCAASDAYTHCPEGFGEFYNQRRRWAPSTMANIMDLLASYKHTIAINNNISTPYMMYQLMLMIGSILGPSTIFLMLVGAMVAAFRIPNIEALLANLIPITLFILICFFTKNDFQILVAQILSALYALLMMAVLVGTAVQLVEDGPSSPSAIFLIALTASFVISAIFHPQEFFCLFHGVLYFLSVPSMYLFLILYSLINLNNVSWGTREIKKRETKTELEAQAIQIKEIKKKSAFGWLPNFGFGNKNQEEDGGISCSLSNLFKCMFCTYPKVNDEKYQLIKISDQLDYINTQLLNVETKLERARNPAFRRKSSLGRKVLSSLKEEEEEEEEEERDGDDDVFETEENIESNVEENDNFDVKVDKKCYGEKRDDLINPYWIEDKDLKHCNVVNLNKSEIQFWFELIRKYLYPIEQNKAREEKVTSELNELRNKVVFTFLMMNSIFILVVFLLQVNKKDLHLKWPIGMKYTITYVVSSRQVRIQEHSLEIDPIGIVFVSFFAIILIIQFIGMLFHRLGTMTHILASEELRFCLKKFENISDEAYVDKNGVQIAREIAQLHGINGDETEIKEESKQRDVTKRDTIIALENRKSKKQNIKTLDAAFWKRMTIISSEKPETSPLLKNLRKLSERRGTFKVLENRKKSVIDEMRRKSTIRWEGNEMGDYEAMMKLTKEFSQNNGRLTSQSEGGIYNEAFDEESF